jgi:hypothetical protein
MMDVCRAVVATLARKNPRYGESWKARGGTSAYENLARKWSRVQTTAEAHDGDVFSAIVSEGNMPDGIVDSLLDLMGYSILILEDQCNVVTVNHGELSLEVIGEDLHG